MQKTFYLLLCYITLFFSCNLTKKENPDSYTLKATDTKLTFPLDEQTKIYIYAMQIYTDPNGEEYLVFQNERYLQLLFYNMKTQNLYKKINCAYDGPDGVRKFSGFFVRNMNEIYVTHSNHDGLSVIDGQGKPIRTYKNKTKEGYKVAIDVAVASTLIEEIDDKLYIPLSMNWDYGPDVKLQKSNLCATLNLENDELKLLPLTHLEILGKEDESYISEVYARCTNGKQFIYSFEETEDLYLTNMEHTDLKKIKAKSKYLPTVLFQPQKMSYASPDNCTAVETARYGNIYYDKYRKVYYRIAYPKVEIEKGVNCFELRSFGGKSCSIMILDEDFQMIGETLLPDYRYNPRLCFVREDGFYISESNMMNPEFDENKLCFRRLEWVEKK